jgi:hypothetical protein
VGVGVAVGVAVAAGVAVASAVVPAAEADGMKQTPASTTAAAVATSTGGRCEVNVIPQRYAVS